jgi:hypothetical protein
LCHQICCVTIGTNHLPINKQALHAKQCTISSLPTSVYILWLTVLGGILRCPLNNTSIDCFSTRGVEAVFERVKFTRKPPRTPRRYTIFGLLGLTKALDNFTEIDLLWICGGIDFSGMFVTDNYHHSDMVCNFPRRYGRQRHEVFPQ